MAFDIASTQNNQVGRMQGWLALWGCRPTGGTPMSWMGARHGRDDMAAGSDGLMPGHGHRGRARQAAIAHRQAFDV